MMTGTDPDLEPTEPQATDLADRWRRLALYGYQVIDQALDSSPSERVALLTEAAAELDSAIDSLDALAMAAEGPA